MTLPSKRALGWAGRTVAGLLIAATLLPLIATNEWWIRVFDYPRAQIAVALLVALVTLLALRGWRSRTGMIWLAAMTIALGYQLARILPYAPGYPVEAVVAGRCAPGNSLRVMVANVLQTNRGATALLERVRDADPDVLLLVETDAWWARAVAPLNARFAHRLAEPLPNTYGLMLFSRLPLLDPQIRHLIEADIPSVRAGLQLRSGARIEFFGLHPRPPVPGIDTAQRDAELVLVGREIKREGKPALVAGDLNDVAWSDTSRLFQKTGGLLDPRVGRGLYPTFPATLPGVLRWPLDHVFFNDELSLIDFKRLAPFGSDHLAVSTTLCFSPRLAPLQDEPQQDAGDRRRANETIREGREEEREERRGE